MAQKDAKNIEKDWLEKELVEMICERKIDSKTMETFFELVARWESYVDKSNGRVNGAVSRDSISDCDYR